MSSSEKRLPTSDKSKTNYQKIQLSSVDDFEEKEMQWLVPQYIPKGQITIMAGDGGSGKTTTWCALAAAVSSGRKVFFDSTPEEFAKYDPGKVLFFSSEDFIEYTLKARLRKAGANLKNIFSLSLRDDNFSEIKFNSDLLKQIIDQQRPELVIFDPLQSFIPPEVQMAQRNAMRNCLNPLIGLGEQFGTTFLIVLHTNKKSGCYGRNRIADSADIWDIARSVLIVGTSSEDSETRYISHEKSNYDIPGETALFTIDDGVAYFKEYSIKHDVDFVRERDDTNRNAPQRQDARKFILDFLNNGKKPTSDLDEAAKAAGISKSTLNRAKTEMRKEGLLGGCGEGYGSTKVWYSYLIDRSS
ncbi:MAG: AAA family ATPase [Dorea sp.]